jgi:hypothetical protein
MKFVVGIVRSRTKAMEFSLVLRGLNCKALFRQYKFFRKKSLCVLVKDIGDFGNGSLVGEWGEGGPSPWPTQGGGEYCYLPDFKPPDIFVL